MLFLLRETRKQGLLSLGYGPLEYPGNYVNSLGYFCGLLHKYLLTTGDLDLLAEPINGITFLQRLEGALEAQLPYRDEETGLLRRAWKSTARTSWGTRAKIPPAWTRWT